jgi:hypothetical protein
MVGTIAPLVKEVRQSRRRRSKGEVLALHEVEVLALHFLSSLAGGFAVFAALRLVRLGATEFVPGVVETVDRGATTVLAVLALGLVGASILGLRLPMRDRQVPIEWRFYHGPARASVEYGFVLGAGLFTRINGAAVYLAPVAALIAPSDWLAAVPIMSFAAARAGIVVARSIAVVDAPPEESVDRLRWESNVRLRFIALQLIAVTAVGAAGIATLLLGAGRW